jgi:SpoVK/Ycf46/Vps4 family AAA+-type ATPase
MQNNNQRELVKFGFDYADDGKVRPVRQVRSNVMPELVPRIYRLEANLEDGAFLLPENDFNMPSRVYGKSHIVAQRFMRAYELGKKNLGALLVGKKGCGKTLTLKHVAMLAVEAGMPAIIVNKAFPGQLLTAFLSTITQQCVVCFDEFDKKYGAKDSDGDPIPSEMQDSILELLDGATVGEKKMFILTANDDRKISEYLKDRPSRIRYTIFFKNIDEDTVIDYVRSNLKNCTEEHIRAFLMLAMADSNGFDGMNFDSMVELVNEMNYFSCDLDEALELMLRNGKKCYSSFEISVFHGTEKTDVTGAYGTHNGVYMATGEYKIEFQIIVPPAAEGQPATLAEVSLNREQFVGFGEDRSMYEFKYGEYTFMARLIDNDTARIRRQFAERQYKERPDVVAFREQQEKEKKEKAAQAKGEEGESKETDKSGGVLDFLASPSIMRSYSRMMGSMSDEKSTLPPVQSMTSLLTKDLRTTGGDATGTNG